jgi:hypothetical protein
MTAVMSRLTNEWLAVALLAVPFLASKAATSASAPAPPLQLESVADIPLGGHPTRLDYASLDTGRHLLFIAHLGDSEVIVFDTEARRVVKRIANVSHVHGVLSLLAPNAHVVALHPITHEIYFPLKDVDGKPVLRIMRAGKE